MDIKQITVAGSGVLGSQIAFQAAYKGFQVAVYDINDEVLEKSKNRMKQLEAFYQRDLDATPEELQEVYNRLFYSTNLGKATEKADLVIEAIPEVVQIKRDFYQELAKVAPKHTIFATNSSTLLPSQFAEATGRPEKFLALHFANEIWKNNTAEIMKHQTTEEQVFQTVIAFAKSIGMVALPIQKEQPGYVLNSLLVPLLESAEMLLVNEVAEIETIDKAWMIGTGAPLGPFAMLDVIGITTAYNIVKGKAEATGNPAYIKLSHLLKTNYIDQGKLGRSTGEGFYKYPNPSFIQPDFLKN
ncbi:MULTISPECIES: 3-hydroxyacyl-CoA dehydrogenase [Niallia]|jgi:3-hydroxyacyl-CoA dehydrogenase|uniref:3-hydroxybutyryl-CoA dehydrogenase n=1 Tax=Niallia circulans TaxID=1397 RepID=A0A268F9B5_NIACI|nr:3-hydroxyacyl-CoA dehydrogenase [Niallia circulans]AYV65613.1 3-hydroxybutyryl-CoA dehydrogenase [Niallia circulans]PAD81961.1 3-hydroxybutyryl-CoA dehydrogenase [Niallia circulans]QJX61506.1 3-hydroxyacyl-CoA dehydrogenase [Niallia circulans]